MPARPTSSPSQFVQCAPLLMVTDVLGTTRYYQEVLGYACDFASKDYVVVWRENCAIPFAPAEDAPTGVRIFNWLNDVDSYYNEIKSNGANITVDIGDRDYNMRDFCIEDCNGITVVFGQDI